jgi:PleD family two-component response regulator
MRIPHEAGATAVTASFGIAQKEERHITLDALIAAADECLYLSKQQGRNRVTTSLARHTAAAQTPERPAGGHDLPRV